MFVVTEMILFSRAQPVLTTRLVLNLKLAAHRDAGNPSAPEHPRLAAHTDGNAGGHIFSDWMDGLVTKLSSSLSVPGESFGDNSGTERDSGGQHSDQAPPYNIDIVVC